MDLASNYEIDRTAQFILNGHFTRVALQFPDELLRDSTRVVRALRDELDDIEIGLFVMADTTFGSCCVDEVGASHVGADCVVHYGHTCLSQTSTLPAFFVFGKAAISVSDCVKSLADCLSTSEEPVLVLYGLEYSHAINHVKEAMEKELSSLRQSKSDLVLYFVDVMCTVMNPSTVDDHPESSGCTGANGTSSNCKRTGSSLDGNKYCIGGLTWDLPDGCKMEDCLIFWIGTENPAFTNILLTYNGSEIVRFDPKENSLAKDFLHHKRVLKRRYYLVEKAKDANIIGILVGTLGVAGYLHMIKQMKDLIAKAGKKSYTLVMGRPNPAKLANFPECNVFIYVSCAQTALLDSKEFLAPVITPFEATLAFSRGSQWTGAYMLEFRNLVASSQEDDSDTEEARFSFLQGGYVEDHDNESKEKPVEDGERSISLVEATQRALQLQDSNPHYIVKGTARSGAEFFNKRSYHGLEMHSEKSVPQPFVIGRTGKASGYQNEKENREIL
ncbi:hypothetical protein Scep_010934 [Stephania cephalantha]|uniref:2-(3-amino-3-carboxypropyl)histidine synthase subunit 2 n=1 Tax=Stephania cephalantha TaxID=152367 RepID=A0AAP0JW35_9MAGN